MEADWPLVGGNSLLAGKATSLLRKELGVQLPGTAMQSDSNESKQRFSSASWRSPRSYVLYKQHRHGKKVVGDSHACLYRHKVHQQHHCQAGSFGIEARSYSFR